MVLFTQVHAMPAGTLCVPCSQLHRVNATYSVRTDTSYEGAIQQSERVMYIHP